MSNLNEFQDPGPGVNGVFLENHNRFLKFLEARVGNSHDAEEILQNAFVRSLEKSDSIRDSESSIAWFYRLLRNAVIDFYRARASSQRKLESYANQLADSGNEMDPDLEGMICECVREMIPALKPEYSELINAVDLQGLDISSAANAAGITAGNARVRLHRARNALREQVERTCRTCATHGCVDCTCSGNSCDATM